MELAFKNKMDKFHLCLTANIFIALPLAVKKIKGRNNPIYTLFRIFYVCPLTRKIVRCGHEGKGFSLISYTDEQAISNEDLIKTLMPCIRVGLGYLKDLSIPLKYTILDILRKISIDLKEIEEIEKHLDDYIMKNELEIRNQEDIEANHKNLTSFLPVMYDLKHNNGILLDLQKKLNGKNLAINSNGLRGYKNSSNSTFYSRQNCVWVSDEGIQKLNDEVSTISLSFTYNLTNLFFYF